jgi:hypothetical protein
MARRADPERIHQAGRAAIRNLLTNSTGMGPGDRSALADHVGARGRDSSGADHGRLLDGG